MKNTTTLVGVAKNSNNTTTEKKNWYWLNCYNHRGELFGSTPYETYAEARAMADRIMEVLKYTLVSEDRWEDGRRVMEIARKGDILTHLADIMSAEATNVELETHTNVYWGTPSRSLLMLLECIHTIHQGSLAEKNREIEEIAHDYYTDAEVMANFNLRAYKLVHAKTDREIMCAILNFDL